MLNDLEHFYKKVKNSSKASSILIYDMRTNEYLGELDGIKFNTRSIAKTIMALSYGILMEESNNKCNLDSLIYPVLKDEFVLDNYNNLDFLKSIKVKHLLTHTTGYDVSLLMSKEIVNLDKNKLLDYCINYPLKHAPGTYFRYSNAGYYILSAFMEKVIDGGLYNFIDEFLFEKLDIKSPRWDCYGPYLVGASKLYLSDMDLLKLGKLLLDKGSYEGINVVGENYISLMKSPLIDNINNKDNKHRYFNDSVYGLGLWINKSGVVYASGTGGQLITLLEKEDLIIVTTNRKDSGFSTRIKEDQEKIIDFVKGV